MANSKISALTAATTPVAGTEVLPIVQSSATKQVSIANLTAGRSVSAADYVMSTGNLVPSTAAKGINFTANTPAAGMTSQLLNWYEEGTWTPNVAGLIVVNGTGGASYSGKYRRFGNIVHVVMTVFVTGTCTTASTIPNAYTTNLPFTCTQTDTCAAINESTLQAYGNGVIAGNSFVFPTWPATNSQIVISGTYFV